MSVPILRSIGTKLTNLENPCKNRMFYLTTRDAKTLLLVSPTIGLFTLVQIILVAAIPVSSASG